MIFSALYVATVYCVNNLSHCNSAHSLPWQFLQNRAGLDISLHDRSLCSIATPQREAEIIGFIKEEPNKTLAFMPKYESAV